MGIPEVTILFGENKKRIKTEREFLEDIKYIGVLREIRRRIDERIKELGVGK